MLALLLLLVVVLAVVTVRPSLTSTRTQKAFFGCRLLSHNERKAVVEI